MSFILKFLCQLNMSHNILTINNIYRIMYKNNSNMDEKPVQLKNVKLTDKQLYNMISTNKLHALLTQYGFVLKCITTTHNEYTHENGHKINVTNDLDTYYNILKFLNATFKYVPTMTHNEIRMVNTTYYVA